MDGVTSDPAALIGPLYDLARVLRLRGPEEAGLEKLPPSELDVLRYVMHHPGVGVTTLARELGLHASNVSATVRALVARDLIRRAPDPSDRRSVRLTPTIHAAHGMALIEQAWSDLFGTALRELTPSQQEALTTATPALRALAEALRSAR